MRLSDEFNDETRNWLARAIGGAAATAGGGGQLDIVRLKGATTSSVYRVAHPAVAQRFALRVLDNPVWCSELPDLAKHEAAALVEAQKTGVRAPKLIAFSENGDETGFGVPVVLKTFLEGDIQLRATNFDKWLDALAEPLAVLHQHTNIGDDFRWQFGSWVNCDELAVPIWTTVPQIWELAIERILHAVPSPASPDVFLHRDYHPTNVLWREDGAACSGVLDWINACRGPAGVDVAHCRTNLTLMFGANAADRFLVAYKRHITRLGARFDYTAYWDLDSVFEMCLPQPTFYAPWEVFGLDIISPHLLERRLDIYMEMLLEGM